MIIRDMKSVDIETVRLIARDAWRATYSSFIPEEIQDKVLAEAYSSKEMASRFKSSLNLVAEENGVVMGYAFLYVKSDNKLFVESLYIHPNYQGRGIGKKLLQSAISNFPNATTVALTVYEGNPNISFYEKEGFKRIKENQGGFFGHPVSFILMEKSTN
ncbi:GNAT family N-acetyltransferase [Ureibacillus chungkukjangi]|uniref:L-amino acid N-acyltransferase YncA n=1 Tax=Ureibacillus chungkukjangi TaxID=1202712 RepID=A0A318TU84_9BACL|nr:GNAT family N-acetyltransferase [Ureibacillus chungkukjangi]PYF08416.1 L-amino acid N-acyltransferase YncA [Ureibacillus chungkukjangi]